MIVSLKNQATEDIFNGQTTKQVRIICPVSLMSVASRKLDQLDSVKTLEELRIPPGNRLEALTGDRKGQWSIRVNNQYRICFKWSENDPEDVEFTDYH